MRLVILEMKAYMKKIQSTKGLTLVEVLVAVLLISIATTALVACVTSASKINSSAMAKDQAFQENLEQVQMLKAEPTFGQIQFDGNSVSYDISYYTSTNEEENLTMFILK